MLGKRFLQINGVAIPNPTGFSPTMTADETISLSEAGTELGRVRRLDKHEFTGTWNLTSFWLKKFEEWCTSNTITLTYQGRDYVCRMRGYNPVLANNSEYVETSEGLWTVSPTFTEI